MARIWAIQRGEGLLSSQVDGDLRQDRAEGHWVDDISVAILIDVQKEGVPDEMEGSR
jgi:hypothetical protein